MKILITGGHLAPALAVIEHIPKNAEVVYVGRKHPFEGDSGLSLEYQVIQDLGIKFISFQAGRLQRTITRHSLASILKAPASLRNAMNILKGEKPDVVLGFGGYLSLPIGIAASLLGIPLVIHEQTMHAGIANKILSKFATKVAISWKNSEQYFPKSKTELVGNPHMQTEVSASMKKLLEQTKDLPLLVITGGSAGSHAINTIIEAILPELLDDFYVLHQTGDAKEFTDFDRLGVLVKKLSKDQESRYHVMKFIQPSDFDYVYERADLVVSRSGINTITSLLLTKTPALLIPLVTGQKNEQGTNAAFLKKVGLAEVVPQSMPPKNILLHIEAMIQDRDRYTQVDTSIYKEQHLHAAERLVQLLYVTSQVYSQKKS